MSATRRLLFVYNADTGLLERLQHIAWSQLRPSTYPCRLCKLTYGALGMRGEWRRFARTLPADPLFLHADELRARHPGLGAVELPALFEEQGGELRTLIPATEMQALANLGALIALVQARVTP